MTITSIPIELKASILGWADFETLCKMARVSHEWQQLAGDDRLWKGIFKASFPEEPLPKEGEAKKRFQERAPIIIQPWQLSNVLTSFCCNLKWDKKRELNCSFPNNPTYSLKFIQSFGPVKGHQKGYWGDADEIEYYKCMIPASKQQSPELENYPPEPLYPQESPIPLALGYALQCRRSPYGNWPEIEFKTDYVNGGIKNVDVGLNNTLGYFSEMNHWKAPFRLFCIPETKIWAGLLPLYQEYRFASIDPSGKATMEIKKEPRYLNPSQSFECVNEALCALEMDLYLNPIRFP
jgi:hypothetical protein